jgi:hypothetical protein
VVDCAVYIDGKRQPGSPNYADAYAEAPRTPGPFVWLGLHEPTEEQMAGVAEVFTLEVSVINSILPTLAFMLEMPASRRARVPIFCTLRTRMLRMILRSHAMGHFLSGITSDRAAVPGRDAAGSNLIYIIYL